MKFLFFVFLIDWEFASRWQTKYCRISKICRKRIESCKSFHFSLNYISFSGQTSFELSTFIFDLFLFIFCFFEISYAIHFLDTLCNGRVYLWLGVDFSSQGLLSTAPLGRRGFKSLAAAPEPAIPFAIRIGDQSNVDPSNCPSFL